MNIKSDDPQALKQLPALAYLSSKYFAQGLRVLAFPSDQGYFEPDIADMIRAKYFQQYSFGQFPAAVVFDKVDVIGKTAHPLWRYLNDELPNPNGVARVTLNFEKFLLDEDFRPVRRYPRLYDGYEMERDVAALLAGDQLPAATTQLVAAWDAAEREAIKSEYAYRANYNVYDQDEASTDWTGLAKAGFR